MPSFISKKSKAQMKARFRKKKLASTTREEPEKKQLATEIPKARIEIEPDSNWKKVASKIKPAVITIPDKLSIKEMKKFRKEKRREARANGEAEPTFMDENNKKVGDKRKRLQASSTAVPIINDLLENERKQAIEKASEMKRKEKADRVPIEERLRYFALDCEMVGIGIDGKESALARVSVTDWDGNAVYDKFVQVPDRVTDFRTWVSGVRAKDIKHKDAISPQECRNYVGRLFIGKILVGHSLKNDLSALFLTHPKHEIRDTATYKPFMKPRGTNGGKFRPRKLKDLAKEYLSLNIQVEGEAHSSVEDASAAMELYKLQRVAWEQSLLSKRKRTK